MCMNLLRKLAAANLPLTEGDPAMIDTLRVLEAAGHVKVLIPPAHVDCDHCMRHASGHRARDHAPGAPRPDPVDGRRESAIARHAPICPGLPAEGGKCRAGHHSACRVVQRHQASIWRLRSDHSACSATAARSTPASRAPRWRASLPMRKRTHAAKPQAAATAPATA